MLSCSNSALALSRCPRHLTAESDLSIVRKSSVVLNTEQMYSTCNCGEGSQAEALNFLGCIFIDHIAINLVLMSKTWSIFVCPLKLVTLKCFCHAHDAYDQLTFPDVRLDGSSRLSAPRSPTPLNAPFIHFSPVCLEHLTISTVFWQSAKLSSKS